MFMYLLETANIMFLSNHTTQNVKYNSVALLLGYNQDFFHSEVPNFLPIIFHTFCPYLESLTCFHGKDLIVQSLYVHLKDRKSGWR